MLAKGGKHTKHVVIVGAGIAGLCSAIALRQHGISVSVYEQASELARVGAGLTLWSNAMQVLRVLSVADSVELSGAQPARARICDADGNALAQTDLKKMGRELGAPIVAVHRADLHRALLEALPPHVLHLGRPFLHYRTKGGRVSVDFEGETGVFADLLVGADGIHSAVRRQLLGEIRLRYAGYTAWRGVVELPEVASSGVTTEMWGCGQRFGIVPINTHQVYWFATQNTSAGQNHPPEAQKWLLQALFNGWAEPVPRLLDETDVENILHNDIYDFAPLHSWHRGPVVLIGDAAHATTPNLGQGACMAIESSLALADSLAAAPSQEAGLHQYARQRWGRTRKVTRRSRLIGSVAQWSIPLSCRLRNMLIKATPSRQMERQVRTFAGYRPVR